MKCFLITEEEKNRILEMHISATRKNYISEQVNKPNNINSGNSQVKELQQILIKKGYDIGISGADGKMGKNTINAIIKFQKDNNLKPDGIVGEKTAKALGVRPLKSNQVKSKQVPSKVEENGGFILIWAFPEYEPKIDGKGKVAQLFGSMIRIASGGGKEGTYGKLGHGGCVVVKSNGDSTCYEFGRYPGAEKGYGKVLTHPLGKIAKINNGVFTNPEQVAMAAKKSTFPPGPSMTMFVAVVKLPNPSESERYASVKQREYSAFDFSIGDEDANCGTFARDVAYAGGIQMGTFCYPTPKAVVNSFKDKAEKMFEI